MVDGANVDFYLTGGTALSRFYLNHRYSDDLDFFVNNHAAFNEQCKKVLLGLERERMKYEAGTTSHSFLRIFVFDNELSVKIDFVNDIAYRVEWPLKMSIFSKVDHWRNILSNKICALSRLEAKDLADILYVARSYVFDWEKIIHEARMKDLWVDPIEICRIINDFPIHMLKNVRWINSVNLRELEEDLSKIHDDIFYGRRNSLANG